MMKRFALLVAALALVPAEVRAQGTTREQIDRAIALYNNFQVEAARPILIGIISPNYIQPVSPTERVDVLKYLGASYALLEKRDSAKAFFTAAVDFDPFTDLDVEQFSAAELSAFNEARGSIFKVGIAPITSRLILPQVDSTFYSFRIITTRRGNMNVSILSQPDSNRVREILFQDSNDGLRQIRWNGVLRSGQFADTGIYMIRVAATRDGSTVPEFDQEFFRIEHHFEPLEDTLPDFKPTELLQERIAASAPYMDLLKGFVAAAASYGLASLTLNQDVKGWQTHAIGAGAAGLVAGAWSFLYRRTHRNIGPNLAENNRRRGSRTEINRAIMARNQAKLDARWIIITPLAGFSR